MQAVQSIKQIIVEHEVYVKYTWDRSCPEKVNQDQAEPKRRFVRPTEA